MKSSIQSSSNQKAPTSRSQSRSHSRTRSLSNSQVQSKHYFCHYKNAMYMGGMKSFTRNGQGILLHDNGTSTVCSYYNDLKHGHNIAYMQNCIMSMLYQKNKLMQIAIRVKEYLLYLRYNKDGLIDGKGVILCFSKREIWYFSYKKGVLINKRQEKQYAVVNRVFELDNLQFLIGVTHSKAIKCELQQTENIGVIKSSSKTSIGFCKRGMLNGLGFTLSIKEPNNESSPSPKSSPSVGSPKPFYQKGIERGYFINSQLTGMGEKYFKNGNFYIGEFKDNIFQGRGILKNMEKNNWVLGTFAKGNMVQLIEYSHQGDVAKFKKLVQVMHERKSSWISKDIVVENPEPYLKEIQKILVNRPLEQRKTLEERKQEVLRKIQDNFICDDAKSQNPILANNSILFGKTAKKVPITQQLNNAVVVNNQNELENSSQSYNSPYRSSSHNRQNPIQSPQRSPQAQQQQQPRSIYNIKILEVPQSSTAPRARARESSPHNYQPIEISRMKASQKSLGYSQIKDESPSFKLDSKRMVGRSRLFKYTGNEEEESLPKFNWTPKKGEI